MATRVENAAKKMQAVSDFESNATPKSNLHSKVPANRSARWNGAAWSALGSGLNYFVTALAVHSNGNLLAGGVFSALGGWSAAVGWLDLGPVWQLCAPSHWGNFQSEHRKDFFSSAGQLFLNSGIPSLRWMALRLWATRQMDTFTKQVLMAATMLSIGAGTRTR